ncbi:MAG: TetR/AcrR family transcriptional regulator [Synechococcales cyanobacterium]
MPKIVDHDQYRRELLLKAFDLFAERGYGSLTMRHLADGLGVSTGTLYHYFQSKEDVFLKLMEELARQDFMEVESALAAGGETLEERMRAVFAWVAHKEDTLLKQLLISISFYQEQHNSHDLVENSPLLATINEGYSHLSQTYLGIRDPDLIHFIDSLICGIVLNRVLCPHSIPIERHGRLFSRMLKTYLETTHTDPPDLAPG